MRKTTIPLFKSTIKPILIVIGILLYVAFYLIAAFCYPGGSNFDLNEKGFHFTTNYWCELLGKNAKNGQNNTAKTYGFIGMIILAFTISFFWWKLSKWLRIKRWQQFTLRWTGFFSMFFSMLIFTEFHDFVIGVSVLLGTIAWLITIYGLILSGYKTFSIIGLICLIFIFTNGIIYLTNFWIDFLPIIQKITFVLVFCWIGVLSLQFNKAKFQ